MNSNDTMAEADDEKTTTTTTDLTTSPIASSNDVRHIKPTIVEWLPDDLENPYNWSFKRKMWITSIGICLVFNSCYASSASSGTTGYIQSEWSTTATDVQLITTTYMIGYVVGPIGFAPLSELIGRRWILIYTFAWYTIFASACALAPNITALLVFRFFTGLGASTPISVAGGLFADIWDDPVTRGRAFTIFAGVTSCAPLITPIISGFASAWKWRMAYWCVAILAGLSWLMLWTLPETYAPVLLQRRAEKMRREQKDGDRRRIVCERELEDRSLKAILEVSMTRPFRMLFQEPIVSLSSAYCALIYGILYLYFVAYPIIFGEIHGFSPGIQGLMFLPNALGVILAACTSVLWDSHLHRLKLRDPTYFVTPEYRRLPLSCLGGITLAISLYIQAWTTSSHISFVGPMIAGLPFAYGFTTTMIGFLNYLADAYMTYSASALAVSSITRSIGGALLPLIGRTMYKRLGVNWASTLLAILCTCFAVLPFMFIRYGDLIRSRSKFCQALVLKKEEAKASEEISVIP